MARAAGVAVSTVSRALNGSREITGETRARVLAAVAALRFTPSSAARSLITGRTHTVGAVLPELYGEYFSELIRGIDLAARRAGLHLLVSSSHGDAAEAAAALRALHGKVDGVLLMTLDAQARAASEALLAHCPAGLPAVLMAGQPVSADAWACLTLDNRGGAYAMTQHLIERGLRRIAFLGGPAGNAEAGERLEGYRAAMAAAGLRTQVLEGDFGEAAGRRAGAEIARITPAARRPDALFAASDMMAIGALAALREAGLDVPRDVALAGFDDSPLARHVSPGLSSVRLGVAELGAQALEALREALDADASLPPSANADTPDGAAAEQPHRAPPVRTIPAELVVRGSTLTAPAPAAGSRRRTAATVTPTSSPSRLAAALTP